jgi:hypothetical protein
MNALVGKPKRTTMPFGGTTLGKKMTVTATMNLFENLMKIQSWQKMILIPILMIARLTTRMRKPPLVTPKRLNCRKAKGPRSSKGKVELMSTRRY